MTQNKFGYITPDGDFIYTQVMEHHSAFKENPELMKYFQWDTWENLVNNAEYRYAEDEHSWTEQLEPDEHPCWHAFDASVDGNIDDEIYSAGFVRFGSYENKFGEQILETSSRISPDPDCVKKLMKEVGAVEATCRDISYSYYNVRKPFHRIKLTQDEVFK